MKTFQHPLLASLTALLCLGLSMSGVIAAEKSSPRKGFEDSHLAMRVSTGKPEQIAAFYTGRGFDKAAINEIIKTCFVSVFAKNKTYEALWLVQADWQFQTEGGKPIAPLTRADWQQTWQRVGLKLAHQSTFSWTQLPASRDLRPDEHVGGNIAIPWQDQPFNLTAKFKTQLDQSGDPRTLVFENLQCNKN